MCDILSGLVLVLGGHALGRAGTWGRGKVAWLHDSAFCLSKAVAKTQLSPLCALFLHCFPGSTAWNTFIPQAGLFGVTKSQETLELFLSFPFPCWELWAAFCSAWCYLFLSASLSRGPNSPPSHSQMCRSLRHACVHLGCFLLGCRYSAIYSYKERDQRKSLTLLFF